MKLFLVFYILWPFVKTSYMDIQQNIILILTDDQDIELGSMNFMPKTLKLIKEKGAEFKHGYVTTPICCPSRSTLLTGLYVHNHNVQTNNQNCSGAEWRKVHEKRSIGAYLQEAGYKTAYFGKYLNEYDGSYIPPGWDEWHAIVKNSKFYNYTMNSNGVKEKFGADYEKDYFTDLVTNRSIKFMQDHMANNSWQPFLLVVSYPAPHGPEDPAPQYSDWFRDITTHRTASWNLAPNPDKQWLLQRTGKMLPVHIQFTNLLHRRRLQTLQSVDEGVYKIFGELRRFNQLWSTYVIYTSDHGYHLGQFGLVKGKNMPYEFDIRVPFFIRGPTIPRNVTYHEIVSNVDIAPTMLDVAGVERPSKMNGRSILDLVRLAKNRKRAAIRPWRDTILIERGKMPKLKKIRDRFLTQKMRFNKENRLEKECKKKKWQGDCTDGQLWRCYRVGDDRWRIYKCRENWNVQCSCKEKRSIDDSEDVEEFLAFAESEYIREHEWFQGSFDSEENKSREKRATNRTRCHCGKKHPIKKLMERQYKQENDEFLDRSKKNCSMPQMNCFTHTPEHWKTPPLWPQELGDFCFCQNCNNNTYWCLRTVNATDNFLYCEFITEYISFYDFNSDPHQLTNTVYTLSVEKLEEMSEQLKLLRKCKGRQCEAISAATWRNATELSPMAGWDNS